MDTKDQKPWSEMRELAVNRSKVGFFLSLIAPRLGNWENLIRKKSYFQSKQIHFEIGTNTFGAKCASWQWMGAKLVSCLLSLTDRSPTWQLTKWAIVGKLPPVSSNSSRQVFAKYHYLVQRLQDFHCQWAEPCFGHILIMRSFKKSLAGQWRKFCNMKIWSGKYWERNFFI